MAKNVQRPDGAITAGHNTQECNMFFNSRDIAKRFVDSMENSSNTVQEFQGGLEESLVNAQDTGVGKPTGEQPIESAPSSTSTSGTESGFDFDHQHTAPPPDPDAKPVADFLSDTLFLYGGGKAAIDLVKKGVETGAKAIGLDAAGLAAAGAVGKAINHGLQNGWYRLNPHKDL